MCFPRRLLTVAPALLLAGCHLMQSEPLAKGRSPLHPARPSPDSVTMEIIWARFPTGEPALNEEAWREIDETRIAPAVRRELANNGFRVGVIGRRLPDALSRALNPEANVKAENTGKNSDVPGEANQLVADPMVHGHVRSLPRHQRYEIQASDICATLPVLISKAGELGGRTFQQAQAVYALRVDSQPDRTVRIELTPELHHGTPRVRWTGGDDGIFRQMPLRDREVFEEMRMNVSLAPGEMLVLVNLPDSRGRLGHCFHSVESGDGPQQKLVLIRPTDLPPGDTFAVR